MTTFVDNDKRTWTVAVTVAGVKRVRATLDIDIPSLIEDNSEGLRKLLADPVNLIDVVYLLCRDQAEKLGLSDVQFGEAIAGDALRGAGDAFLAAFVDFFPDPRVRAGIKTMIEMGRKVTDLAMKRAEREIASIDIDREAERLIDSFGTAPASSASTPAPSPSANSS